LACDFEFRGDRPTFFPGQLEYQPDGPLVTPVNWHGSSDLRSTADANSMIHFPAGDQNYQARQWVEVHEWAGRA
jgi:molybdopterin biosynthesis enzyme